MWQMSPFTLGTVFILDSSTKLHDLYVEILFLVDRWYRYWHMDKLQSKNVLHMEKIFMLSAD